MEDREWLLMGMWFIWGGWLKYPKIDGADGCTTLTIPKTTEMNTFHRWVIWYVTCISIKLFKNIHGFVSLFSCSSNNFSWLVNWSRLRDNLCTFRTRMENISPPTFSPAMTASITTVEHGIETLSSQGGRAQERCRHCSFSSNASSAWWPPSPHEESPSSLC